MVMLSGSEASLSEAGPRQRTSKGHSSMSVRWVDERFARGSFAGDCAAIDGPLSLDCSGIAYAWMRSIRFALDDSSWKRSWE